MRNQKSKLDILTTPKHNPVFETDSNLNITMERFKQSLPIKDVNELIPLLAIYQNTLINSINQ
jgi:hypothetical protein